MASEFSAPGASPHSLRSQTMPDPAAEPQGFDRELLLSLAKIPFIALVWFLAAAGLSAILVQNQWLLERNGQVANLGPVIVIAFGMILAAAIDGYAFKVPNWCTLSLVMSGWYIGLSHDLGLTNWVPGLTAAHQGGILAALVGTTIGFFLLFPALFLGGMGEGDVKMTMGFGSWLGAYFGLGLGLQILFWSFAIGVLVGGVFGIVIIVLRRRFRASWESTKAIGTDLHVLATEGHEPALRRATSRRPDWVRLPYGVPLCIGFLGYLSYFFLR
jgi:prepilin peptidase CpaA